MLSFNFVQAEHVSMENAQKLAMTFFETKSNIQTHVISDVYVNQYNTIITFYAFSFSPKGFVIVSADNNVRPILAYSSTDLFDGNHIPPSVKGWLEQYSKGIYDIVMKKEENTIFKNEWKQLMTGNIVKSTKQFVLPLITTLWDQGCHYNEACPLDTNGPCGHTVTGCVATAIAQVMKY